LSRRSRLPMLMMRPSRSSTAKSMSIL
jgi:hypothetical protein